MGRGLLRRQLPDAVEWLPGELHWRVGFIVTNQVRAVERIVAFGLDQPLFIPAAGIRVEALRGD